MCVRASKDKQELLASQALYKDPYMLYTQGLLGDAKMFKMEFEKRITAGNDKHATGRDRQIAAAKAAELRARIAPFFLRREKTDVLPQTDTYTPFAKHCFAALKAPLLSKLTL